MYAESLKRRDKLGENAVSSQSFSLVSFPTTYLAWEKSRVGGKDGGD